jgi:hypothetical protein
LRQGRFITAGLAALVALAMAPGVATAAPATFVDDTEADFSAGAPGASTVVRPPGSVELARIPKVENFDGPGLPLGWNVTSWDTAQPGTGSVAGGELTVNGARVDAPRWYVAGQVMQIMEFTATFGAADFQHVGFGNTINGGLLEKATFADGPWAMFSTRSSLGTELWARTLTGPEAGGGALNEIRIMGVDPTLPHTYRIEWSATQVKFFVDGGVTPAAVLDAAIAGEMRPAASDFNSGGPDLKIDKASLSLYADTGAFESRVHDAGDAHTVWGKLTSPTSPVAGTEVKFETRSGNTATPDASWSAYQAIAADGAIQSPSRRYIQYKATLSTGDDRVTPSLDRVELGYEIDNVAPSASLDSVQVSGTTATATFSSGAADLAGFECSLDGGAFATCTSPKAFTGLAAGSHTISVRAVDKLGNAGDAVSKTVSVAAASGGTPPPPPSVGTVPKDTKAPLVSIGARSIRVSKRAAIRVTCPADETNCTISVRLKYGRKTAGKKTVTVAGGQTVKAKVLLSSAARTRLAKRGRLNVTAIVTARDAAGNSKRREFAMTLRPM